MIVHELSREAEAARALLVNLRDIAALTSDDDQVVQDAIEGETNLKECAAKAVSRLMEINAMVEAIEAQAKALRTRAGRLTSQADSILAALQAAFEVADIKRLELPAATVSRKRVPSKLDVVDEALIPASYWTRGEPTLDRRALLAALKRGETIAGSTLINGAETIAISWR